MKMLTNCVLPTLVLASLMGAACAHAQPTHQAAPPAPAADHTQIVFKVASAQSDQMLPGVKVSMIARDGSEVELGQTDMFGKLSVPKALFREHQARVVLFSRDHFFTGAITVGDPLFDFYAFDERYIELAVFAVI